MDALSCLVRLARLRSSVDTRCFVAGRHTLDHPTAEAGRVPFRVLLSGVCELELAGRRVRMTAGDMVLLPRGTAHRIRVPVRRKAADNKCKHAGPDELVTYATSEDAGRGSRAAPEVRQEAPVDLCCGHYIWEPGPGQVLMAMLPEIVHVSLSGVEGGAPCSSMPLGPLSDFMRSEACVAAPGAEAIMAALCDVLLTLALRATRGIGRTAWLACTEGTVRTVTEAVLRDPAHGWGIEKFAALNSMSRATFIRHFTRETGMTPGDFLIRLRMLLAADLLTGTDRPVSFIARAVGYGSESSFGRAFRLATGSTPAQLRRVAREETHDQGRIMEDPLEYELQAI